MGLRSGDSCLATVFKQRVKAVCACVLGGVSSGDFFGGEESRHKQVTLLGLSGSSENPRGRWTLFPFCRQEDCLPL